MSPSSPAQTVKRNREQYKVPLVVVSYQDLYGWTMDAIVKEIGLRNNCAGCRLQRWLAWSPMCTAGAQAHSAACSGGRPWTVAPRLPARTRL